MDRYENLPLNFNCLINETKKLYKLQEPCNYNLHQWINGVNKQVKLDSRCTVGNNSSVLPTPDPCKSNSFWT